MKKLMIGGEKETCAPDSTLLGGGRFASLIVPLDATFPMI